MQHTLTSKKAEPKVGHLKMSFRKASLASSLDLPACLLKYATMDCRGRGGVRGLSLPLLSPLHGQQLLRALKGQA